MNYELRIKKAINIKIFFLIISFFLISAGFVSFASAASIFDITYPIDELGGCASQQECKTYCDDLANKDACLIFAEKNGFISKEKVEQAKKYRLPDRAGVKAPTSAGLIAITPTMETSV